MMTRRTVARGLLLTTGTVAAIVLAGCGSGQPTASGGSGTTTANTGPSSAFVPVTSTVPMPTGVGGGGGPGNGGGEGNGTIPLAGGTPACKTVNLKLSLGQGNGAAGHVYQALQFTNSGAQNCVLFGFPGVSYVTGSNGTQVGPAADRDGALGAQVLLKPGQVASTIVTFTDVGVFDAAVCKPTQTLGLRVYPPGSTAAMFIARTGTGCAGTPPSSQLRVQTIKPGLGNA
jgi:hypothetical protein